MPYFGWFDLGVCSLADPQLLTLCLPKHEVWTFGQARSCLWGTPLPRLCSAFSLVLQEGNQWAPEAHLSTSEEEARKRFYWRVTVVGFLCSPVKGKCTWPLKCAWSAVPNGLIEVYETNYSVRLQLIPVRKPLTSFSFYAVDFIYFSSWFCSVKWPAPPSAPQRAQSANAVSFICWHGKKAPGRNSTCINLRSLWIMPHHFSSSGQVVVSPACQWTPR